ncbi:MAG: glycoside hydrolase family 97 N-terminal domain-containing protein [Acidobacteriia bacterium]|nr:glycoside hydrolase family 97 N-terminal domain-containing protein [Terriglobia bacterium]
MRRRILTLVLLGLAAASAVFAETDTVSVASPDGQLVFRLFIVSPKDSILVRLAYSVTYHGKLLMDTSLLGITLHDVDVLLGETVGLVSSKEDSVDAPGNHYHSLIAQYLQNGSLGRRVTIEARAYDDGVAFRYYIPRTSTVEDLQIEEELTDFHFAQDGDAYSSVLSGYQSEKGEYSRTKLSGIKRSSLLALPFLVEQPGVGWVAITEAQIDNYPGMYVFHPEGTTMRTTLAPRFDDAALAMHGMSPAETPWRVLMVASEPRKLLDSGIVENLNPASKIADTSWIKQPKDLVSIADSTDLDEQFAKLERTGVAGVAIDLKNRSDQQMIELRGRAAKMAAAHHLMVEFLNGPTLDGIERTWPNVILREDTPFRRLFAGF